MWLEQLTVWLVVDQLQLNIKKRKYVSFTAKNKPITQNIWIKYESCGIERTISPLISWCFLDEHLSWATHINLIHGEVSRPVGTLK